MKKLICLLVCLFSIASTVSAGYVQPKSSMTLLEAMGIDSISDVRSGYVMSLEQEKAVTLSRSQISAFCDEARYTTVKRRIVKNPFCGFAIVLNTYEGEKTYFVSSGVQVGKYGEDNYFCYTTDEEIAAAVDICNRFRSGSTYSHSNFTINTETDYLVYPQMQWAVEDVLYAASNSLLPYEISESYGKAISREEFCILIANFISVCGNFKNLDDYFLQNDMAYLTSYFTDTKGRDNSINMLCALGIINGKSDTEFGPGDALTREESAVILKNAAVAADISLPEGYVSFSDMSKVSNWALHAVRAVGSNGIMSGTDGKFMPKDFLTCEQAIAGINRLFRRK